MQIAKNIYKNKEHGFEVQVDTCNKKVAKCTNNTTGEKVTFNRAKFEWMVNSGVFQLIGKIEGF